jgi:hypothetical protein
LRSICTTFVNLNLPSKSLFFLVLPCVFIVMTWLFRISSTSLDAPFCIARYASHETALQCATFCILFQSCPLLIRVYPKLDFFSCRTLQRTKSMLPDLIVIINIHDARYSTARIELLTNSRRVSSLALVPQVVAFFSSFIALIMYIARRSLLTD